MAVFTVPGFGDDTAAPTPASNWSSCIQQIEARRWLPFFITSGDNTTIDGTVDPHLALCWIDKRGTGRPPPARNWLDQVVFAVLDWPPPAPNWLLTNSHSNANQEPPQQTISLRISLLLYSFAIVGGYNHFGAAYGLEVY
jgi:hypothetical protein